MEYYNKRFHGIKVLHPINKQIHEEHLNFNIMMVSNTTYKVESVANLIITHVCYNFYKKIGSYD